MIKTSYSISQGENITLRRRSITSREDEVRVTGVTLPTNIKVNTSREGTSGATEEVVTTGTDDREVVEDTTEASGKETRGNTSTMMIQRTIRPGQARNHRAVIGTLLITVISLIDTT